MFLRYYREIKVGLFVFIPLALSSAGCLISYSLSKDSNVLGFATLFFLIGLFLLVHMIYVPSTVRIRRYRNSYVKNTRHLKSKFGSKKVLNSYLYNLSIKRIGTLAKIDALKKKKKQIIRQNSLVHQNWRSMRGVEFELFIKRAIEAHGFTVKTTNTTGDQGVDLIASKHGHKVAIQVKGYSGSVGNNAVQQAYSGMAYYGCNLCAVITNSYFTSSAITLSRSTGCQLIDGQNIPALIHGNCNLLK